MMRCQKLNFNKVCDFFIYKQNLNLKTIILLIIYLLSFSFSYTQTQEIELNIEESYNNVKVSWETGNSAVGKLSKCIELNKLKEIKDCLSSIKNELLDCKVFCSEAEEKAKEAVWIAFNINCFDTEMDCESAASDFEDAESSFDDAISEVELLFEVTELKELKYNVEKIKDLLLDSLTSLERGNDNLRYALENLTNCY